jgi:pimeloyl-ACP methyl ester carboxylesterase
MAYPLKQQFGSDAVSKIIIFVTVALVGLILVAILLLSSFITIPNRQIYESQFQFVDIKDLTTHVGSTGVGKTRSASYSTTTQSRMNLERSRRGYTTPTLVLLHDVMQGWSSYSHIISQLVDDFSLVYPDLRGHNYTVAVGKKKSSSLETIRDDIIDLIQFKLLQQPVILVGHGLSGVALYVLARDKPELFNKAEIMGIITINAPHYQAYKTVVRSSADQQAKSAYISELFAMRKTETLASLSPDDLFKMFKINTTAVRTQDFINSWSQQSRLNALDWIFDNYKIKEETSSFESFEWTFENSSRNLTVTTPTLMIWGNQNQVYSKETLEASMDYFSDLRIKELRGSYNLLFEEPTQIAQAIREFVFKLLH